MKNPHDDDPNEDAGSPPAEKREFADIEEYREDLMWLIQMKEDMQKSPPPKVQKYGVLLD